jgi:HEAT repeat protein
MSAARSAAAWRAGQLGGIAVLLALCALPARGEDNALAPQILYALTSIDTAPTRQDLVSILGSPTNELTMLRGYALGPTFDFGMRLRAIRAIPQFCPQQPVECHDAIVAVLDDIDGAGGSSGQKILRRRAAIEALGAARTGDPGDLTRLVAFLNDGSRDIRVAAVRALRDLCDPAAMQPLRDHARLWPLEVEQVKLAITDALSVLSQCGP